MNKKKKSEAVLILDKYVYCKGNWNEKTQKADQKKHLKMVNFKTLVCKLHFSILTDRS